MDDLCYFLSGAITVNSDSSLVVAKALNPKLIALNKRNRQYFTRIDHSFEIQVLCREDRTYSHSDDKE